MPPRSPLAPARRPVLPPIAGVRLAARACGVRYKDRTDVCLMAFDPGTTVAGVFTRSLTASAPVDRCRRHLKGGKARAILVNSGNANAFTGKLGNASVRPHGEGGGGEARLPGRRRSSSPRPASSASRCRTSASRQPCADLAADLNADAWAAAAAAIMTTDTFAKLVTRTAKIDGVPVTINGIAKGSGMIQPDMATMLAFRRHRCEASGRGAAARCCAQAPTAPSTASPSTATPPPATRCCCARPARPAIAP